MQQGKSARFIPLCMIAASYFLASFVYAGGISPPPPPKAPAPTSRDFAFIVSADNYWFRPLVTVTGGTSMSTVAHS